MIFSTHTSATTAHVIGIIENQAPTHHLRLTVTVRDGQVCADLENDLAKISLIERHKASGIIQMGLVQGFGFTKPCAIATTVSHDCHNLLVVGTDDRCMAMAANTLTECGGGQVVVLDEKVIGLVELPIAGLMANDSAELVAKKTASILDGFRKCGCQINNPNMTLSLLGLVVIPSLRISDQGVLDTETFNFIKAVE